MKIAILTDSSSGLQTQSFENLFVLSLPIIFPNITIIFDNSNNEVKQSYILNSIDKISLKTSCIIQFF